MILKNIFYSKNKLLLMFISLRNAMFDIYMHLFAVERDKCMHSDLGMEGG